MAEFIGGQMDGKEVPRNLELSPYIEMPEPPRFAPRILSVLDVMEVRPIKLLFYKRDAQGNFRLPNELPFPV